MKKLISKMTAIMIMVAVGTVILRAEVKLPAIFSDNMVLQQQTNTAIWGKATPGSNVTIKTSWNGKSYSARADKDGNWKTKVSTPPAGGQYTVTISDGKAVTLRNVMINPIAGYGIRGAIWYQGEANRNEPAQYQKLMPGLAENWRSVWGDGEFPMYYVQIAPFDYGPGGLNSALLREAQLKAATEGINMGMACIMDTGEKDCIHPANKKEQ